MGFIVFFLTAILSGAIFENGGAALFLGFLCYLLYRQNARITLLEKHAAPVATATEAKPEIIQKQTEPIASSSTTKTKETTPPPPPKQEPSPKTPVTPTAPSRSFAEILEGFVGPSITHFILQGNPIARIGSVVLLIGVVFLLKLAAEQGVFPPELRLIGSSLLSIVLLAIGWKLRKTKKQFSVTLQGTGSGIFYITACLAFRLYELIPGPLAFVFLVGITFVTGWLSLLQDSRSLAIIGLTGGFLAPLLTSEGGGSHIALFSYLAILNLGVFGLCWFKAWRAINLTAFIFTFAIASSWGSAYYTEDLFVSCQIFLVLFALLYALINALYSINENREGAGVVDSLMTFIAPVFVFSLQWPIVRHFEYGSAISASLYGAMYVVSASILFSKYKDKLRFLVESYLLIGLVLISLAVPFAFSTQLSSAIWALEASALVWSGIRQSRFSLRSLGLVVLVGASILFLGDAGATSYDLSFRNTYFLGILLLTLGHIICGALLTGATSVRKDEKEIGPVILFFSVFWWALGGGYEVVRHSVSWFEQLRESVPDPIWLHYGTFSLSVLSLFGSISITFFWLIWSRWVLPGRNRIRQCMIPLHVVLLSWFFIQLAVNSISGPEVHLLSLLGIISWPFFFGLHYFILWREEKGGAQTTNPGQHAWGLWLLISVITWEVGWVLQHVVNTAPEWRQAAWIAIPAFFAIHVLIRTKAPRVWPLLHNSSVYRGALWVPILWALSLSFFLDFASPASAYPLPYVPLLNPLDLAQALSLLAALVWFLRFEPAAGIQRLVSRFVYWAVGPWIFVWATSTLIRILHHFFRVRWKFDIIFDSQLVQASLSIFWSVLALTLMLFAHRKRWRIIWQAGAALIGIVVLKLFVIDLSSQGTIARIAAFVGVGLLMLLIGYLAPIPPEVGKEEGKK